MELIAVLACGWAAAAAVALACGLRVPWPARLARRAATGARARRVGPEALGSLAAGAAAFVLVAAIVPPAVATGPACAVAAVPWSRRRARARRVLVERQAAWPDALRDVLASVTSGRSVQQALVALAETGPAALLPVLAEYPATSRAVGTVDALQRIRARCADPVTDRVVEVLRVAHERGGTLVRTVLEDLVAAVADDLRLQEEQESAVLEHRVNARAVTVLPWAVLVLLTASDGPFRDFYASVNGVLVVTVAGVLTAIGSTAVARLGRVPVEARVLTGGTA